MLNRTFRSLTLAVAVGACLLVFLGGMARAYSDSPVLWSGLDLGYRAAALVLMLLAGGVLWTGGRAFALKFPALFFGAGLLPVLAAPALLWGPVSLGAPYLAIALCPLATWLAATVFGAGAEPFHSRLSVFRSQWQVPLYAGIALLVVTVLGSYLKSLDAPTVCGVWPLCAQPAGAAAEGLVWAHLAHRAAAGLAGIFLLYTMVYVWRKHAHRPVLLVLTGSSVVLYTVQVILGAEAARGLLSELGGAAHLVTAAALIGSLISLAAVGYYAPSLPVIAGASAEAAVLPGAVRPLGEVARDYLATTKPRILVLLLITGYAAMVVAQKGLPDLGLTLITMLGLGMSCGAANAINMWYDRDIDCIMNRTQKRPIPAGRLTPAQVLGFGVMTGALSFVLLALAVNLLTALLSLAGLLFYVCIYTMWLKRSTTQNIVIGGAAGAVPPLVGWAAVTGDVSWAAVVMFLIVFMWTPPHFWALALFRNDDYRRANIPMLPVVKGEMHTKWQILFYSVLMVPSTAALYWTGVVGEVYLWVSTALGLSMIGAAVMLLRERLPVKTWAVRTFIWSIFWLGFVFLAMVLDIRA